MAQAQLPRASIDMQHSSITTFFSVGIKDTSTDLGMPEMPDRLIVPFLPEYSAPLDLYAAGLLYPQNSRKMNEPNL